LPQSEHSLTHFFVPCPSLAFVPVAKSTKKIPAKAGKTSTTKSGRNAKTADAENKILEHLFDMYELDQPQVAEDAVVTASGYSRPDSTGYRDIMKDLKQRKLVEKKNKMICLTPEGLAFMKQQMEGRPKVKKTNESVEQNYKEKLVKSGKGKLPAEKLNIVWDVLRDRQAHSTKELLAATGYKAADSTGYRVIMKALREAGLITTQGGVRFVVKKVFPYPDDEKAEET
jgi:hypothetical protein